MPVHAVALPLVTVKSSPPEDVSGEDALIEVQSPVPPTIGLNGEDVSKNFSQEKPGSYLGLVTGLHSGRNEFHVRGDGNRR